MTSESSASKQANALAKVLDTGALAKAIFSKAVASAGLKYHKNTGAHLSAYLVFAHADEMVQKGDCDPQFKSSLDNLVQCLPDGDDALQKYVAGLLLPSAVTEAEQFLVSCLKAIYSLHPGKLNGRTIKAEEALTCTTKEELLERLSNHVLNELTYAKPLEFMEKFSVIASVTVATLRPLWQPLIEIKARRDIGVHNDWRANEVYLRKLAEAGAETTVAIGDSLLPDVDYYIWALQSLDTLVQVVATQLEEKMGMKTGG